MPEDDGSFIAQAHYLSPPNYLLKEACKNTIALQEAHTTPFKNVRNLEVMKPKAKDGRF
jgi:hypothetical protein